MDIISNHRQLGERLHVARHAPVGARRERQRDFRAVGDAIALVLRGAEPSHERVQSVVDNFWRILPSLPVELLNSILFVVK